MSARKRKPRRVVPTPPLFDKDIVRWDAKRAKWRRIYQHPDGSRRLTRDWRHTCADCGSEYWSGPQKKVCWACSRARMKKLEILGTMAVATVARAIKEGNLCRLDGTIPCTDCGRPAQVYDHRCYLRPLDVEPVCRGCNSRRGPAVEHEALVVKVPRKFRRHSPEQLTEAQRAVEAFMRERQTVAR